MHPVIESLTGVKRRAVLKVSVSDVDNELNKELLNLSRTTKISGFRPGKAPLDIVKRTYGANVRQDVISRLIGGSFEKLLKENDLSIVGFPSITPEKIEDNQFLSFVADFEVYPNISIPDFSSLNIKKYTSSITDDDVNKTLDFLRKQKARFEKKDNYCASNGDKVTLKFIGTIDGEPFNGGSSDSFSFVLGNNQLLSDFENAVIGMKSGDKKIFNLTFPENYHDNKVAGKTAEFSIEIIEVLESILPDLNDDFAKLFSNEDGFNLDKLKLSVQSSIEREVDIRLKNRNKSSVMNVLLENIEFEVPESLVSAEVQNRLNILGQKLKSQGKNIEDLKDLSYDKISEESAKMVRFGLLISDIAKKNNLYANDEQIFNYVNDFAKNYENQEQFINNFLSDKNKKSEIEALVIENNVVDHVLSLADVTEENISFETLMGLE
ncbi:trigger factor [Candidatus Kinetoplastibacterium desouzaii TCC079E]|uniref:Trigger factor n=1 Tax=Candidatus Kinetoplastidibacterium desouzai TCC079E TaxID=1208919 RepID=M1LM51_9PROT|nr:trigger factor [Candidatus Kinetoplastibacterium desouzaii]AGF46797.1 trigger factor [Candidatus Kinetoplastibacterium desouzaii TCC079E]